MALVDVQTAKTHLRVLHGAEDSKVEDLIAAAEVQMRSFLGRNVYASDEDFAAARAAAPAALSAASASYATSLETIQNTDFADDVARDLAYEDLHIAYYAAIAENRRTMRGIVMTKNEQTALLQIVAHLWANRGEDAGTPGIPDSARNLLWCKRIGVMGLL